MGPFYQKIPKGLYLNTFHIIYEFLPNWRKKHLEQEQSLLYVYLKVENMLILIKEKEKKKRTM